MVTDARFLKQVLGILSSLERSLAAGYLVGPARTDIFLESHAPKLRSIAKIIADVFCSVMQTHGRDEKLFAKLAEFLGMNITLTPGAYILGSAAGSVSKPLAF